MSPPSSLLRFTNALLHTGGLDLLASHDLVVDVDHGVIVRIVPAETATFDCSSFDCGGRILSPGFVDVQLNGAFGVDFSNAASLTSAAVQECSSRLLSTGVTSYCPTLVSLSPEEYERIIPLFREHLSSPAVLSQAKVLGLHLEGPFFNPKMKGAHSAANLKAPSNGLLSFLSTYSLPSTSLSPVILTTLAPELPGSLSLISSLAAAGVRVSLGHTNSSYDEALAGLNAGATLLTHLYNQMTPFHHRSPGLLPLLSSSTPPFYSVIADGVHVSHEALRVAWTLSEKTVLVTDAMAAMGLPDGEHSLGSMTVVKKGGEARLKETASLAGSVAGMDHCVRTFRTATSCTTSQAIEAATGAPARMLGIEGEVGALKEGRRADLVMLEREGLEVVGTWREGRRVWRGEGEK